MTKRTSGINMYNCFRLGRVIRFGGFIERDLEKKAEIIFLSCYPDCALRYSIQTRLEFELVAQCVKRKLSP